MTLVVRLLLILLTMLGVTSFAHGQSDREFLRPIEVQKGQVLTNRYALELARHECFAKPGKIGIYEFDIEVLARIGEEITITPFNGEPIDILSQGIFIRGGIARWRGLADTGSDRNYRLRMQMVVAAVDSDGNSRNFDRNREIARKQVEHSVFVGLAEPYLRPNEKLTYLVAPNEIQIVHLNRTLAFRRLGAEPETLVVYEVDESKTLFPVDGMSVLQPDGPPYQSADQKRRKIAFDTCIEKSNENLGYP